MICRACLKRIPLSCSFEQTFKKTIEDNNFLVTGHDLTVYGYCFVKLNALALLNTKQNLGF